MLRSILLVGCLACAAVAQAGGHRAPQVPDEPLRVYAYGAPGGSVYVAPVAAIRPTGSSDAEIGFGAFARKYLCGTVPLKTDLKPGQYLVSVVMSNDLNMRDASIKAGEYVWDGYDYHAVVGQKRGTFRYSQSYLIDKKQGFPAEVLAVFADQMPEGEPISYNCGAGTTPYTGTEDDAAEMLTAQHITMTFHDDLIKGLKAGMKVLLRTENDRFAVQPDGMSGIKITVAHGQGAWAAHRLSIVPYE